MDLSLNTYGDRLRHAMLLRNYSARNTESGADVTALARAANVSYEMGRKYLAGTAVPRRAKSVLIADWLNISLPWLETGVGTIEDTFPKAINTEQLQTCYIAAKNYATKNKIKLSEAKLLQIAVSLYNTENWDSESSVKEAINAAK